MGLEHSHWEGRHWVFFFCSFSLLGVLCYVIFHPLCNSLDYTDVWHCSQPPALNVGVLTVGLYVPDVTFTWPPGLIHWSQVPELQYSWIRSSCGCYRDSSYFSLALLPHVCAHKNLRLLLFTSSLPCNFCILFSQMILENTHGSTFYMPPCQETFTSFTVLSIFELHLILSLQWLFRNPVFLSLYHKVHTSEISFFIRIICIISMLPLDSFPECSCFFLFPDTLHTVFINKYFRNHYILII